MTYSIYKQQFAQSIRKTQTTTDWWAIYWLYKYRYQTWINN